MQLPRARFANELVSGFVKPEFKIWKTVKLGTGLKTRSDFCRALEDSNCHPGDWISEIFDKPAFVVSDTETELDLVNISLEELGYTHSGATYIEARGRGPQLGLELCPPEVGPQLRLQYLDQPMHEWLYLAMETLFDFNDSGYYGFSVRHHHDNKLWLNARRYLYDSTLLGHDRLIFVKPRK